MSDELEAAWGLVWNALPARWAVGAPSFAPGIDLWSVTAVDSATMGRGKVPRSVTRTGDSEPEALLDLAAKLRGVEQPDGTQLEELRRVAQRLGLRRGG